MPVYPGNVVLLADRAGRGAQQYAKTANYRRGIGIGGLGFLGQTPEIDAARAELNQLRAERLQLEADLAAAKSPRPVDQPAPTATSSAQSRSQGQGLLRAQGSIEVGGAGSTASTYSGTTVAAIAAGAAVIYLAFFRRR